MKHFFGILLFIICQLSTYAQNHILIKNVNVWDGISTELRNNVDVLVRENLIHKVAANISAPEGTTIIEGNQMTLIPGLSDMHVHLALTMNMDEIRNKTDWMYTAVRAAKSAENFLMLGFTTVRDLGGPSFGIKRAIDEGLIPGPRIYPSGAFISQTAGHGDARNRNELSGFSNMHPVDALGWSYVVDGEAEVLKASRENLKRGATQLKVMAGGGIDSEFDPIHSLQFTTDELEAAVQAAADWDTYVAVHIYNSEGAIRALNAGVKCLDHGHLLNEEAIRLIKEKNAWLVPQCFWIDAPVDLWAPGMDSIPERLNKKIKPVLEGTVRMMDLAKKHEINIGFGSDAYGKLGNETMALTEFKARTPWYTAVEILKQATSENARLLGLSGKANPYEEGDLGVIKKGAYADLLIYDGNPLEDIEVIENYKENLKLIMKDGKIYKNDL